MTTSVKMDQARENKDGAPGPLFDHGRRGEADAGPVGRHQHALQLRLVRRRRPERQGASRALRAVKPGQHVLHELNHPGEAFRKAERLFAT